jgi:Zn-dependent metalloprotease
MKRIVIAGAVALGTGLAAVAVAGPSSAATAAGTDAFTLQHATSALHAYPAQVAATSADSFTVRGVSRDADGSSHVRYDRTYQGLEIIGGDIIVHLDKAGTFTSATAPLAAPLSVSTTPAVSAVRAAATATTAFPGTGAASAPTLAVDALDVPRLVWKTVVPGVRTEDGDRTPMNVLVDAQSGAIESAYPEHQTGTGNGFHNGTVTLDTTKSGSTYQLKDPTRGGNNTVDAGQGNALFTDADDKWGDGTFANRQTAAVDAQFGTAMTWDYYKKVHNRNGIANDGKGAQNRVHYGNKYDNAFWQDSCFCMTYGDGNTFYPLVSLDVAGHEMSHGVTSRTAKLVYSREPGGLNESTSDIFGTAVEFYANSPKDVPDYLIGEKLIKNGKGALRYMDDPKRDGRSASCWTSTVGNLDVHWSSGVGNHFFFMLAVGSGARTVNGVAYNSPTCNGAPAVNGIGINAAERIWYRALTTYFTSGTNYKAARAATLKAATDLFGANSTQYKAVAAAWTAAAVS